MKKLAILFSAAMLLSLPAMAQVNQPLEGHVVTDADLSPGARPVIQRYWTPSKPDIGPGCSTNCGSGGVNCDLTDPAAPACPLQYRAAGLGYRGYTENLSNWGAESNTVIHSVFDYQEGANTGSHRGYFAWIVGTVIEGETSLWTAASCAGTGGSSCIGRATSTDAVDEANTPQGSITKKGGLQPIPVPKAALGSTGESYNLSWTAVASKGENPGVQVLGYDLYVAKTTGCGAAPADTAFSFLKTVTGTTTTVTAADAGLAAGQNATFALKIRFPGTSDAKVITTKYLSANGQCFNRTGQATTVYDLAAKYVGGTNVEVNFKTSLEDGVQSFDIMRATTQNGTYTKVGNIAAKGQPSSYSFIDTIQAPQGPVKASGLFYKVVAIDIDNGTTSYGPVSAALPQGTGTVRQQMKKSPPKR